MSYAYKIQQVSARKWNAEIYALHDDCGPYCIQWIPLRKRDIHDFVDLAVSRGIHELREQP